MDMDDSEQPEISTKKVEANRRNAQKSTGPRTIEGKRNSSRNSVKHGLLSKDVVVTGKEDPEEFDALLSDLKQDLKPKGRAEEVLVETIAACDWRQRRALRAEVGEIINGFADEATVQFHPVSAHRSLPGIEASAKILRYETAIHRQKMQIMQLLEKLQQRRRSTDGSASENSNSSEK
jgi:hypothetical protein